jgi:hypothetical protein
VDLETDVLNYDNVKYKNEYGWEDK